MRRTIYDAIIIGAGPAGGWAAATLTNAGLHVLVLEAGPSQRVSQWHRTSARVRRRLEQRIPALGAAVSNQAVQSRCYAWHTSPTSFINDADNPYTTPPDQPFLWIRSRQMGGRMLVPRNGLQFYRMSDFDFKAATRDGAGSDWPLSYADLAPYYDRVEHAIGLTGNEDNIAHLPNPSAIGRTPLSTVEKSIRSAIHERWPERTLIARRTAPPPFPMGMARRPDRLTIRHNAIVREVTTDPRTGLASGVNWLQDGAERFSAGKVVVLAASSIESARIMLNSRSGAFPAGLANSSGLVGCYLMDHTSIRGLEARVEHPSEDLGVAESFAYIPQFRNVLDREPNFRRGYGIQLWTQGPQAAFTVRGEMISVVTNRVTIDPIVKDKWGIPVPRIACQFSENEVEQSSDAVEQCKEMMEAAGLYLTGKRQQLDPPGLAIHECGTVRMGIDPATSVLDPHNRAWDVRNLFVVDASCFVSQGVQNPTLTIMALSLRASEHIIHLATRREL